MSAGHVRAVAAPHPERRGDPDAAVRRTLGLKPVDTEGPAGRSPCCKVPGGVGVTETGGWGWAPGVGRGGGGRQCLTGQSLGWGVRGFWRQAVGTGAQQCMHVNSGEDGKSTTKKGVKDKPTELEERAAL